VDARGDEPPREDEPPLVPALPPAFAGGCEPECVCVRPCDPAGATCEEPCWCFAGVDGVAGAVFEVDVVGDVVGDGGGGGGAVVGVVVVTGAQDSETPRTGRVTGSDSDDSGVPGGTSTVKLSFAPPTTVTVTTHDCASAADGNAASPPASTPTDTTATPPSRRAHVSLDETTRPTVTRTMSDPRRRVTGGSAQGVSSSLSAGHSRAPIGANPVGVCDLSRSMCELGITLGQSRPREALSGGGRPDRDDPVSP
jgi:hypothetical protein